MTQRAEILIDDLTADDEAAIQQVAAILVEGFREHWPDAWSTLSEALEEIHESFEDGRISRVARDEQGAILGWIGGQHSYASVWELHPMVVRGDQQKRGIGRLLVADLEQQVLQRGGLTLMLGTDDEDGMTSLSGVDLYPNLWQHIANIRNLKGHPYEFYQKQGFTIVGVVPDANGLGKPDIMMAKRLG